MERMRRSSGVRDGEKHEQGILDLSQRSLSSLSAPPPEERLEIPKSNQKSTTSSPAQNKQDRLDVDVSDLALEDASSAEGDEAYDDDEGESGLLQLPPGVIVPPKRRRGQVVEREVPDPNDPNFRKRPRKSYTEKDKKLVIEADAEGGRKARLQVAKLLGMPARTADNIVSRAWSRGQEYAIQDHRHDSEQGAGRPTKRHEYQIELLQELLHNNASLTLEQLRREVNEGTLRQILVKHGITIPEMNSSPVASSSSSSSPMVPVSIDALLKQVPAAVAADYRRQEVKSSQTILNWLNGMVYTKKHIIPEKTTVNSPKAMQERLRYAIAMKNGMRNKSMFVVFIDEMPFYLSMRRTLGRAPKGKRAVVKTPPTRDLSFRTQVAMAVNPQVGLIFGKQYPPKKSVAMKKDGTYTKPVYRAMWNKETFKDFLNDLLEALYDRRLDFLGQKLVLVLDNAPECGPRDSTMDLLRSLPKYRQLKDLIVEHGGELLVLRAPPNSPQLNLCEYYNRTLRTYANVLRQERSIESLMLEEKSHGEKLTHRLNVLEQILDQALDKVRRSLPQSGSVVRMMAFFDKVIAANGYLE